MRTRSRVPYQRPDTSSDAVEPDTEVQIPIAVHTTYASSHGRAHRSRGSTRQRGEASRQVTTAHTATCTGAICSTRGLPPGAG